MIWEANMTVKITARFPDTESADFSLGRILQAVSNIYESRVYYDSESDGVGIANNILYYAKGGAPTYNTANNFSSAFEIDRSDKLLEECLTSVICERDDADEVRSIIYNGGGCDVYIFEV